MSEAVDRRAAQKARTRQKVRVTAQELFAVRGFEPVTINEIAALAGVSVQTVFNHFSSKEDLFFAERAAWVDGPAAAVRGRAPGEAPKAALRRHLVASVEQYARSACDPRHQAMLRVLESSPTLLTFERGLHDQCVRLLAEALAEAWQCTGRDDAASCAVLAEVTASVWMAAVRTLLLDMRGAPPASGDDPAAAKAVALLGTVLDELTSGLNFTRTDERSVCRVA